MAPGIRRIRSRNGFRFVDGEGRPIRDRAEVERIHSLAIPPAWEAVWISPRARAHLQATGRDKKGRKQYRYSAAWRARKDGEKYRRVVEFGAALSLIHARVRRHLSLAGLPLEKVLAAMVRILERTGIRVGNEAYARDNRHFGLTTLRRRHVRLSSGRLRFEFVGKSGKDRMIELKDRRVLDVVEGCHRLPGNVLFQYLDESGKRRRIRSEHVNDYLRAITHARFTAKDFRTWKGTLLMAQKLRGRSPAGSQTAVKRELTQAIDEVAQFLGNTRAICRSSYVHPMLIRRWSEGALEDRADEGLLLRLLRGEARTPR